MDEKLEVGDIVQLNSGGPMMTVGSVTEKRVACAWFADGKLESIEFDAAMLTREARLDALPTARDGGRSPQETTGFTA